jgi:hypothetical protein
MVSWARVTAIQVIGIPGRLGHDDEAGNASFSDYRSNSQSFKSAHSSRPAALKADKDAINSAEPGTLMISCRVTGRIESAEGVRLWARNGAASRRVNTNGILPSRFLISPK